MLIGKFRPNFQPAEMLIEEKKMADFDFKEEQLGSLKLS